MAQRVTLRDVAQHVGVSVTTVSNVMRGWPYVAEETRRKVQEAVLELKYTPNPIAQSLRTGQVQTIGFIVPHLSSPYFAAMVSVAEEVALEHAYSVIVFNAQENLERQDQAVRRAGNRLVDGLLIAPCVQSVLPLSVADGLSIPIVLIDRVPYDSDVPWCAVDNIRAAEIAVTHLVELGHRRIAHISGPNNARPTRDRRLGYEQMLVKFNLHEPIVAINEDALDVEAGYHSAEILLSAPDRPTAIFTTNDEMAIGAMRAASALGLRVPEDVSIIGIDDINISAYLNPPLTTIHQPLHEVARAGIELLLSLLNDQPPAQQQILLEPSLKIRASTAAPG
jgi:DNA-binding LacI/PurR family transcriptional regulator